MVFKKNMNYGYLRLIKILLLFFILSSCTYKYDNKKIESYNDYKKIYLNVGSLELKKNRSEEKVFKNSIEQMIFDKLLISFEQWALNKFQVKESDNNMYVDLEGLKIKFKNDKKSKVSKYSFYEKKKEIYEIDFIFSLTFINKNKTAKKVIINSKKNFTLFNNYSIKKRNEVVDLNLKKLMYLIDSKVSRDLSNEMFYEFILN
ncbi:MAG: hypothetical protein CMP36_02935 [Rickettsiales bacterium]|nr:hypothetical protein [Rickettsiales bacterium]OUV79468.1 MAG: hypothetical protein CBC91_03620 [Rickettsiales bacterium TMED131]|tara:strand:+ start:53 stop:661 length:609 start_codon:yes stop_codon:yes gene_type:complete